MCLVVLGWPDRAIGNRPLSARATTYEAALPDATGLSVNDAVKVAGVEVGTVTGIEVERGKAVVIVLGRRGHGADHDHPRRHPVAQRARPEVPLPLSRGRRRDPRRRATGCRSSRPSPRPTWASFLNAVGPVLRAIDPEKANPFIRALNEALAGNEEQVRDLLSDTATR